MTTLTIEAMTGPAAAPVWRTTVSLGEAASPIEGIPDAPFVRLTVDQPATVFVSRIGAGGQGSPMLVVPGAPGWLRNVDDSFYLTAQSPPWVEPGTTREERQARVKAAPANRTVTLGGKTYPIAPQDAVVLVGALALAVDGQTSEVKLASGDTLTLTHEDVSELGRQLAGVPADEVPG